MGGRALQVVVGHVCVSRGALIRGRDSVLTDGGPREAMGSGLHQLSATGRLLLGQKQALVTPLARRRLMRPLLWLVLGSNGGHLGPTLLPHGLVHLSRAGR